MKDLTKKYTDTLKMDGHGNPLNPNKSFLNNEIDNYKYLVLAGATRSGKTHSAISFLLDLIRKERGNVITIAGQSFVILRATILADFKESAELSDIMLAEEKPFYNYPIFHYNCNKIQFVSVEDDRVLKNIKTDYLCFSSNYVEKWESAQKLIFSTSKKVIIEHDLNLKDTWIQNIILEMDDAAIIRTTYKHNPFIHKREREELEWMEKNHPESYKIVAGLPTEKDNVTEIIPKQFERDLRNLSNVLIEIQRMQDADDEYIINQISRILPCKDKSQIIEIAKEKIISVLKEDYVAKYKRVFNSEPDLNIFNTAEQT